MYGSLFRINQFYWRFLLLLNKPNNKRGVFSSLIIPFKSPYNYASWLYKIGMKIFKIFILR